ncbi:MAG: hypothetical protein PHR64_03465 [Candidatus Shapirobacteria bacterium]|nr:hypothetical protein [Candidatus Shapirobacteria bacterium]MDD5481968.1 hypothetical protein [Candidatus Shapirobacteria bacterium]
MAEFSPGIVSKEQSPTAISVSRLIDLTRKKRAAFGVEPKKDGSLAQEPDIALRENNRANSEPVLARLKELQEKKGDNFDSLEKLIESLNQLASEDDPRRFPNIGDQVSFNVSGRVFEVGLGDDFLDWYLEEAVSNPQNLVYFAGANTWDNPPEQFEKTLFLPIGYVVEKQEE